MSKRAKDLGWSLVRDENPSHYPGSVTEEEGKSISWQSPMAAHSSQVICTSTFGALRHLPDGQELLSGWLGLALPHLGLESESWRVRLEYLDGSLLGETGLGNSSNIDVFCEGERAVVCIEAKFLKDAQEGFGGCGVAKVGKCRGHHGRGSAIGMVEEVHCRLSVPDGRRAARRYWDIGQTVFADEVLKPQEADASCPLKGPNFQLMRNLLFAKVAAGERRGFGFVAVVPRKTGAPVMQQVAHFRENIVRTEFRSSVGMSTYDQLADMLMASRYAQSQSLGHFLRERLNQLL